MSTPVSAPTWQSLYQDWTAQAASGAPDAAVYSERLKVIEPTLKALGITGADGAPPTISVKAESPSGTGAGNTLFPNGSSGKSYAPPDSPAPVSDAQGHTQGHIVATDPSTYDKYINEACDYYGKLYGVKLDPNLVKAHIWQESKGDPLALSQDGQLSRGLMQVSNSAGVPTASILSQIRNPDGTIDTNIPAGGGNQYDPRTSIFTGVKYDALAMSGKMPEMLSKSGLSPTELGTFPNQPISQTDAMRAYQGGPGVLTNPTPASQTYALQLTGLQQQFAEGKAPSDPGYTNPAGGREPKYGDIV